MSYIVTPTARQHAVAKILVEYGGNTIPISKAMIRAGYSPATAKTPQKLTESKGFKLLISGSGLDDKRLAQTLCEGLYAVRGDTDIPDHAMRLRYVETILKLRGIL